MCACARVLRRVLYLGLLHNISRSAISVAARAFVSRTTGLKKEKEKDQNVKSEKTRKKTSRKIETEKETEEEEKKERKKDPQ